MRKMNRRQFSAGLAATGAGCLGVEVLKAASDTGRGEPVKPAYPWPYHRLDADVSAEAAYSVYEKGHCMYGVFAGIVGLLAEKHGQPYASFPLDMMDYGMGGVMGYGSLCGALNGAAAVVSLFVADLRQRGALICELFGWYEQTPLPVYAPKDPGGTVDVPRRAAAGSVICHISAAKWCKATGQKFDSASRKERCKRLTADTARKTIELLNGWSDGKPLPAAKPTQDTAACLHCHRPGSDTRSSFGRMNCGGCHQFAPDTHPPEPNAAPREISDRQDGGD